MATIPMITSKAVPNSNIVFSKLALLAIRALRANDRFTKNLIKVNID
jgi:hypothetical protein